MATTVINSSDVDMASTLDSAEDTPLYPRRPAFTTRSLTDVIVRSRDAIVAIIACVGALSMGFSLGYSSPALQDKYLATLLNNYTQSWFGSLLTVGAMAGGPLGAMLVDPLGRKVTLILCNVPLVVGWFFIIYATKVAFLYTGRLELSV